MAEAKKKPTIADIIALRLQAQVRAETQVRRDQIFRQLEAAERELIAEPDLDISPVTNVLRKQLSDPRSARWIPLSTILAALVVVTGSLVAFARPISPDVTILGFNVVFIVTLAAAGFLGSFVRVLQKVVGFEYATMSNPTAILVMLLRPLAGMALGLLAGAVFATGIIVTPLSDLDRQVFDGVTAGSAFLFAIAFVAGVTDDFALNIAGRLAAWVEVEKRKEPKEDTVPAAAGAGRAE